MKKKSMKSKIKAKKSIAKNRFSESARQIKPDIKFKELFDSFDDSEKKIISYYKIKDSKKLTTLIKWLGVAKKIYGASKITETKNEFDIPKAWMAESDNLVTDIAGIFKGEDGKGVTVIIIEEMFKKGILIKRPKGCNWHLEIGEPTLEMMILLQDKNNNDIQKSWREKVKKENEEAENQLTMF